MAPPIDYGSTLAFIIFMHELALIPILLAAQMQSSRLNASESNDSPPALNDTDAVAANDQELDEDTRFLYDVVARDNEGIVQNIDALDNGLIAVVVGGIAVALFVGDKFFAIQPTLRFAALVLLAESATVALLGYLSTYFVNLGAREIVRVTEMVIDFGDFPAEVTERAIVSFTRLGKANRRVRLVKRAFIIVATCLIFVAAILIVVGRALGSVSVL